MKESSGKCEGIVCLFPVLVGNMKISLYHLGIESIPNYEFLDTAADFNRI
jgi:hypothetical protein